MWAHNVLCWLGIHAWGSWQNWGDDMRLQRCRLCFSERSTIFKQGRWQRVALIALFFLSFATASASAAQPPAEIPEDLAVKALIGEAGGQGQAEQYAHACALVNRGTLRGVYGLHAKHTPNPSQKQIAAVTANWREAMTGLRDVTGGRTEWRSDHDLKLMARRGETPKSAGLYDPLRFGETTFYRLKGGR